MKFKRATIIILLIFFASLAINAIMAEIFGLDLKNTDPNNFPQIVWLDTFLETAILIFWGSWVYFGSPEVKPSAKNGFVFGVYAVFWELF